jgi:HEPN domain-containing protein
MSAELLIANYLRIAAEDLEGARLLAASQNRNAIYLCQQAAEKVIRAVVTSEGPDKHAGPRHDLAEMVDLIRDGNPLKRSLRAIEHLSQYATTFRYPVTSSRTKRIKSGPSTQELQDAIAATGHALAEAVTYFAVDLQQDTPAVIPRQS